jgi:hypothetical protein
MSSFLVTFVCAASLPVPLYIDFMFLHKPVDQTPVQVVLGTIDDSDQQTL